MAVEKARLVTAVFGAVGGICWSGPRTTRRGAAVEVLLVALASEAAENENHRSIDSFSCKM